jgi:ABC-2 type transport system ATP-binding protein
LELDRKKNLLAKESIAAKLEKLAEAIQAGGSLQKLLKEAEELCDRIAIINHGKIIVDEDKRTLLSRVDGKEIQVMFKNSFDSIPENLNDLIIKRNSPHSITITFDPSKNTTGEIITRVQSAGLVITDLSTKDQDLEDVFLRLTSNNNSIKQAS